MTDRKYNEDEVAAIFRAATDPSESQALASSQSDGLTLGELHGIAREVGIPAEAVTRAARSLTRGTAATTTSFLGIPVTVERTVELDRNLDEREWELLVTHLRRVFHAQGKIQIDGSFRQWSNGNLRVLVEPTNSGYQLRLGTTRGDAKSSLAVSIVALGMAGFVGVMGALHGTLMDVIPGVAALGIGGSLYLGSLLNREPRWAKLRRAQMNEIAEQVEQTTTASIHRIEG